jgi:sugar phosphate isomerase/epimerase
MLGNDAVTNKLKPQVGAELDLALWPSPIMHLPLKQQLSAAAAGQFSSLAVAPTVIRKEIASGLRAADVVDMAEEYGVALRHLDGVSTWARLWHPTEGDAAMVEAMRPRFDISVEESLDLGKAVGAKSLVAVGAFAEGAMPTDEIIESFAALCDKAKAYDMEVDLEFISLWGIRELPAAWEIVKSVDRDNAHIMVETWHMMKGSRDYERDIALLEQIPGRYLRSVQVVDGREPPPGNTMHDEAMYRTFPGEGVMDIDRVLSIIMSKGGLECIGPEAYGHVLDGLSPAEFGRRSGETTRAAVASAQRLSVSR